MSYCYDKAIPHSVFADWEPEDKAKVVAYRLEEAVKCQMCGTAPWEWEEDRFAYEPVQVMCKGCYLKDITSETEQNLAGVTVTLLPREQVSDAMRQGGRFN